MSFDDLFADLEAKFGGRLSPPGFYIGEGYGKTMQDAYISMIMAEQPHQELDGVYATRAYYLEPPEPGVSIRQWRLDKIAEHGEGHTSISFGYIDNDDTGREPGSRKPGIDRYKFFGLTAPHPAAGNE